VVRPFCNALRGPASGDRSSPLPGELAVSVPT
jgi:hypothetical protein